MKFFKLVKTTNYLNKIYINNLTAIYANNFSYVEFFKNGVGHNAKNASHISKNGRKEFCLNGIYYGNEYDFTKQSWRKFVRELKLQAFL